MLTAALHFGSDLLKTLLRRRLPRPDRIRGFGLDERDVLRDLDERAERRAKGSNGSASAGACVSWIGGDISPCRAVAGWNAVIEGFSTDCRGKSI